MEITTALEEKLKSQMGTWYPILKEYVETEKFTQIMAQVKRAAQLGKKVAPASSDLWNAFKYCPREKFRILMLGYCPYHTFDKEKKPIADGVMFSNSRIGKYDKQQPSLETFYNGMEEDLGFNINMVRDNDLKYLSEQGILMLNAQLTVEEGKAGIHTFWDNFTTWFIKEVINKQQRGIICLFYGQVAAKYEKMVNPLQHYCKVVEHPAASSHNGSGVWKHGNLFSYCNKLLMDNNGDKIVWYKKKEEQKVTKLEHSWLAERLKEADEGIDDLPF